MKTLSSGLLVFTTLFCSCVAAPISSRNGSDATNDTTTTAMNANDNSMNARGRLMNALKIGKVEVSSAGIVTVEIENSSTAPLKVWNDSNSWGAACWRVLLIRNGRVETFFQNPDQRFTMNGPTFEEIAAGGRAKQKLDLNGGNWCGLGHCARFTERGFGGKKISFESTDMLIVIYDVPASQEARDLGVWYGVIASTATVP